MGFFLKKNIALLSFSRSSAAKYMSLNNEQRKTRSALINLNPVELHHYFFMISLDKYHGNCNALTEISGRIFVTNKTENIYYHFTMLAIKKSISKI